MQLIYFIYLHSLPKCRRKCETINYHVMLSILPVLLYRPKFRDVLFRVYL